MKQKFQKLNTLLLGFLFLGFFAQNATAQTTFTIFKETMSTGATNVNANGYTGYDFYGVGTTTYSAESNTELRTSNASPTTSGYSGGYNVLLNKNQCRLVKRI